MNKVSAHAAGCDIPMARMLARRRHRAIEHDIARLRLIEDAAAGALIAYRRIFGNSCWNDNDRIAFHRLNAVLSLEAHLQ
ncbi:hypothetical protein LMIY3S_03658 [Labrys miyagiensis]